MATRTATAEWNGGLMDGNGTMKMASGAYEGPYTFKSRFEEGEGTNPEELIAAAHAGCFSMAFSASLGKEGFNPVSVKTTAKVHLTKQDAGFTITKIDLITEGKVPNIDEDKFKEIADAAKKGCPVSRALGGVPEITVDAKLV
ncbi:MAG: OsmC family protein [Candidatus Zixiibacteriota bacterium]